MKRKKNTWYDVTSYNRNDTERIPSAWRYETRTLTLSVHRHIHHPGAWMMSCHQIGMDTVLMRSEDADDAKTEVLERVELGLSEMLDDLRSGGER